MKLKKLLVGLLAGVICLSSFVGCGNKTKYDPDNFLPNGTAENPYQIVKEKTTINVFVPRGSMNPHYDDMRMFQVLEEKTNLDLQFNEVDTSAYTNVRSAVWEDKSNLPDLFLFNNPISEQVVYSQYDALVPFNDPDLEAGGVKAGSLIDNYMPNYKGYLNNNFNINTTTSAKDVATLPDGYMYSTLSVKDVPRDMTFKMWINQKWMDNLNEDGITMPDGSRIPDADDIKTVEQYIDILRLFKTKDPNHNGKQDEIPVASQALKYLKNFILAAYGYVNDSIEIKNDGSEIVYVPTTEAYKKYLETMNVLYKEGLIDQSTFDVKTDAQLSEKGMDGDSSRLGSFVAAAAYIVVGNDRDAEYTTFGPVNSSYYTGTPLQWGFGYFSPTGAVIPSGTPYVREIARLLDIMYSELGQQLLAFGQENVDWKWDDTEKTSWSMIIPSSWKGTQEEYRAKLSPNVGTGAGLFWSYDFISKCADPITSRLNKLSERYMGYLKEPFPSEIKLSGPEYDEVTVIEAAITQYIANMEFNFVTGAKSIDKDWNSFITAIDKYDVARFTQIYNDAYQSYKARKA